MRWLGFVFPAVAALVAIPATAEGQFEELVVRQLKFSGNHAIDSETMKSFIATTNSGTFATSPALRWMGLGAKRTFNQRNFETDVIFLMA